mmetsp:Transcript_10052/g.25798  ORF Transcript_10052/g.25798 Transcript_10052/m.25798 type:complete len:161 (-) Transcript_10052:691-1173(-)
MASAAQLAGAAEIWHCSSCTFQNPKNAAKCAMCQTAKASSRRAKSQMRKMEEVQQQQQQELLRLQYEKAARQKGGRKKRSIPPEGKASAQRQSTAIARHGEARKATKAEAVSRPRRRRRKTTTSDTKEYMVTIRLSSGEKEMCKIRASRSAATSFGFNEQ